MNNPCYKCQDRKISCHGSCKKYIRFREELDEFNNSKKQQRAVENDYRYFRNSIYNKRRIKKNDKNN